MADLARRYLDRDLFKALNVSQLHDGRWPIRDDREPLRQFIRDRLPHPDYYFGEKTAQVRGYSLYQEGIVLQTDKGQAEIATLSPLVHALIDTPIQTWVIYPHDLESAIQDFLSATTPRLA